MLAIDAPLDQRIRMINRCRAYYVYACRLASLATSERDMDMWKETARDMYAEMIRLGWTPEGIK